jgi:hypothetical protein
MKFRILTLFILIALMSFNVNSQKIKFIQIKTIEYHPEYSAWDDWPDNWFDLNEENKFSMYISEEVIGKVYRVIIYKNNEELTNMAVRYDPNKSSSMREEWDNPYVNCYYDDNGDYIYASNVSLEQLAKDSSPWKNDDSIMYFWIFSQNLGIALR